MPKNNLIAINEIVKKYKVTPFTVNHYTDIGLLNVVSKRKNIRLYDEAEVKRRLKLIVELKDKGYPLRLIRMELLKNPPHSLFSNPPLKKGERGGFEK